MNHDQNNAEMNVGEEKKDKRKLKFEFLEHNVSRYLMPTQYESSNNYSNFKYDVNPRTGFDDWTNIEPIAQCDSEIM